MSNLAHNTKNDTRAEDFKSFVHEKGREHAAGEDSLPSLAVAFARAVADGVIDIKADSSGKDAAARVFEWYATSAGKKAYHNRTGTTQQVSKLRQIGKAANTPKWDFVDVLNRGIVLRRDLMDNNIEVKPAYAAYVDIAREQLKHDDAMTDAMLDDVVRKVAKERDVTLEGELKKIEKALENVISGEKWAHIRDQSQSILTAAAMVKERRVEVELQLKTQKVLDDALANGVLTQEEYEAKLAA